MTGAGDLLQGEESGCSTVGIVTHGSEVGRTEYSLVGWGWGQGRAGGSSSLESSGAMSPCSPSWRPGLGQDGRV